MAVIDTFRTAPASRLWAPITNLLAALAEWNDARRTRNELSKLSAHELDDLGLVRGDIDEIAHKGFLR